ncbi:hypothetical protein [Amycolatopsis suaedae]|uniref:Galactokinase n=1 Tax=Amycolatopsis suaedae TaxID=2510978 RepID=A0A4Q7J2V6_9PSEU|nr:hypothetical protein [Amycolatopsis suaedae]RZQ60932.1 hypothetical protein EWH70_25930 [Amycolatopsis suaedae]
MIDLADRPDVAPELRLVPHAFREAFGRSAEGVWYAPGLVRLLPGVAVCARWGAIVAGERRTDGRFELVSINRPAEPVSGLSGDAPAWARPVLEVARRLEPGGATLMCSVDLPAGSGLSAGNALACAAALALRDLTRPSLADVAALVPDPAPFAGQAQGVDLAEAVVLVADTRIRRDTPVSPVDFPAPDGTSAAEVGRCLTAYHRARPSEPEQDLAVRTALDAGAYGASMLVDDPGRPVVALVPPDRVPAVRAAVSAAFHAAGARPPRYLTVRPARAATRVTA